MRAVPSAVEALAVRLDALGWVSDLLVGGSLAAGDYVPGVSDLDLVAIASGPVDPTREAALVELHRDLDLVSLGLGCAYVEERLLPDRAARHPTWTHGRLVRRALSGIARAELARVGFAVVGRGPRSLLEEPNDDEVRAAALAELQGYWAWAVRRPWLWLHPAFAELGLTSMARARHTIHTGRLLTKTAAVEQVAAPAWLIERLRRRRRGEAVPLPRLRTGWVAWRDARRTVERARVG